MMQRTLQRNFRRFHRSTIPVVVATLIAGATFCGSATADIGMQSKLTVVDAAEFDLFGNAVSISGDLAIIGAVGDDDEGASAGAAYVFRRTTQGWVKEIKLTASDAESSDQFGFSVGISGDYAIVGAPQNGTAGDKAGAAYVFRRLAPGVWTQQIQLLASDAAANDQFGRAVSIYGDAAAVGSPFNDDGGINEFSNTGSVYVFRRLAGQAWTEEAKLNADVPVFTSQYGTALAITGDDVIVGAMFEDAAAGAAYVFHRSGAGVWSQQARLEPVNEEPTWGLIFGSSVAIQGNIAAVGAIGDDSAATNAGSAFVFRRDAYGVWSQEQKIYPVDPIAQDRFGSAASVIDGAVVIGASGASALATTSGYAAIFSESGGVWEETLRLIADDGAPGDEFGVSIGASGDSIIVGARSSDDAGNQSGSAYVFELFPPVDLDGSGTVDGSDLAFLLGSWGACPGCAADFNHDGVVDGNDLSVLLGAWGD